MVFSSAIFVTLFLPLTLIGYLGVDPKRRNTMLLVASLIFYYWGAGAHILVLFWVVGVTYVAGRSVRTRSSAGRWFVIAATIAPLIWFKYAAFAVEIATSPMRWLGVNGVALDERILPVGISFFTFQALSYVLDIERGDAEPLDGLRDYMLYIALFPQLIAGPIVRFAEIRSQLHERRVTAENLSAGAARFAWGLAKKVVIADSVAPIADVVFAGAGGASSLAVWIGVVAYTVQIYFDFSGYSDMAIGLGQMLGFEFPENFARPYAATSITDFWRRWHITLSSWFRDYVYIPLGGSRGGRRREYGNLGAVFVLTALWHGAAFTFLVWGAIHGIWLIVERVTGLRRRTGWQIPRRALTLVVVMVAWVFFRAADLSTAGAMVVTMFTFRSGDLDPTLIAALTPAGLAALAIGVASFSLPGSWVTGQRIAGRAGADDDRTERRRAMTQLATTSSTLGVSLIFIASNDLSPFLYFQF